MYHACITNARGSRVAIMLCEVLNLTNNLFPRQMIRLAEWPANKWMICAWPLIISNLVQTLAFYHASKNHQFLLKI